MDNYANTFSMGRCTNICVGGEQNPLFLSLCNSVCVAMPTQHWLLRRNIQASKLDVWRKLWQPESFNPSFTPSVFALHVWSCNSIGEYERQPFFTWGLQQTDLFSIPAMSTSSPGSPRHSHVEHHSANPRPWYVEIKGANRSVANGCC